MERAEDNEKIARWLEPMPPELTPEGARLVGNIVVVSPKRCWYRGHDSDRWLFADFYAAKRAIKGKRYPKEQEGQDGR